MTVARRATKACPGLSFPSVGDLHRSTLKIQ